MMTFLVTLNGVELYRCAAKPTLRPGETCIVLDPAESDAELQARIAVGQMHTVATLIAARCVEVEAERDRRLCRHQYDFGAGHGVLTLQLRDLDDRANWLTLDASAQRLVVAGNGTTMLPLRTAENVTLMLPASDVVTVMAALSGHGQLVMAASWEHKDTLRAMTDLAAVAAYDVTTGWPL